MGFSQQWLGKVQFFGIKWHVVHCKLTCILEEEELCLLPALWWFLAWLSPQPWRWRWHVSPKCWFDLQWNIWHFIPEDQLPQRKECFFNLSYTLLTYTGELKMLVRKSNIQLLGNILYEAKVLESWIYTYQCCMVLIYHLFSRIVPFSSFISTVLSALLLRIKYFLKAVYLTFWQTSLVLQYMLEVYSSNCETEGIIIYNSFCNFVKIQFSHSSFISNHRIASYLKWLWHSHRESSIHVMVMMMITTTTKIANGYFMKFRITVARCY
jgi:hypothetical protein